MAESIEQLSYELSTQTLGEQERALAGLRQYAGTVLAAASIAGSFLATKSSDGTLDFLSSTALLAFGLAVATAIWVLVPHPFTFAFGGAALLGESDQVGGVDVTEGYRAAVLWMAPFIDSNRDAIQRLSNWFSMSCAFLAAEVILWTISFA